MGGFGGGLLRADNAVRLFIDDIKYMQILYIIFAIIKLKSQRNEGEKKIKEGGVLFCGRSRGQG